MFQATIDVIFTVTFWLYFANAILLIIHEIESAYWKEWELFKMKGGITFFLVLHFPILGAVLYGLLELYQSSLIGIIFSIVLCLGGLFAFSVHTYFIKKGHDEFKLPISKIILVSLLVISIAQLILTLIVLFTPITSICGVCS